ncbi:MAG TPA: PAS domain S-box protein [Planctomycetota bacterium]|nr:PAS domain S-box protein [Planctomycetota bacterium]
MPIKKTKIFRNSLNLYKLIRLVLGQKIPDRQIARRWEMDEKNFHEFKEGKYPVPRLSKLGQLADVLGINKSILCQAADGVPAQKIYQLLKTDNHDGMIKLLSHQLYKTHKAVSTHGKRYRDLFEHANDAILIADIKTGKMIDCNKEAENLLGRPKKEIIGMHQYQIHPLQKEDYYKKHFKSHVKMGRVVEKEKQYVIKKDGMIVPVLISARVMKINGKKVIHGIFRDISGQKRKK